MTPPDHLVVVYKMINCDNQFIDLHTIRNELATNGRKVFHPFREVFDVLDIPDSSSPNPNPDSSFNSF